MLGLSSDADSISLSVMALAQQRTRDSASPCHRAGKGWHSLPWMGLLATSLLETIADHAPGRLLPKYKADYVTPCSVSMLLWDSKPWLTVWAEHPSPTFPSHPYRTQAFSTLNFPSPCGLSGPPCLHTCCSPWRNVQLPRSPCSKSSSKTPFRCFPLLCPHRTSSLTWGGPRFGLFDNLSAGLCLAISPSQLEARNHWLFISVSRHCSCSNMFVKWIDGWLCNITYPLISVLSWFVLWILTCTYQF